MAPASSGEIGQIRTATSPSSSAWVPPAPQASTGPNIGSATTPTSISTPPSTIAWTRKRSRSTPAAARLASIAGAASSTAAAPPRPVRTAPSSVLWTISGPTAFSATAAPSSAAARPAAAGSAASRDSGVAIP